MSSLSHFSLRGIVELGSKLPTFLLCICQDDPLLPTQLPNLVYSQVLSFTLAQKQQKTILY